MEVAGGASKKTASTAIRKSSTYKGSAANKPVMERAKERAAERNLKKGNDFIVLDTYSDDHLTSVVADCCVVFTQSAGTPVEALSLIRAKERVQVALASVARC
jgi:UDP-N-acetylglucosamine 2-epimerase